MTRLLVAAAIVFLAGPAFALEPIPGSITYGGQPRTKLMKSPIGSSFTHVFREGHWEYQERYILDADRSLRLVSRGRRNDS